MISKSKLHPPRAKGLLIQRPELLAQLELSAKHKLTLLTAPAGFGKSTLLAQWQEQHAQAFHWLSLDPFDNQVSRFWLHIIAALQQEDPSIGLVSQTLLNQLQLPAREVWLTALLNDLYQSSEHYLILEDYHVITEPELHDSLKDFILQLPPQFHLIISSRTPCKELPLSRLRAQQELIIIQTEDLRFQALEIETLFNISLGSLPRQALNEVVQSSEGWALALQMMMLCLQKRKQPHIWLQALVQSQKQLQDYLIDEVFSGLPKDIQDFLLKTSLLEHLNDQLCDYVLESTHSQRCLELLQDQNIFMTPLDENQLWWRYHQLFAELLQQRLEKTFPDLKEHLYRRASEWFAKQKQIETSIQYGLKAHDYAKVADSIKSIAFDLLGKGQTPFLRQCLDCLPQNLFEQDAFLQIIRLWVWSVTHQYNEIAPLIDKLPDSPEILPHKLTLLSNLARKQNKFAQAIEYSQSVSTLDIIAHKDFILGTVYLNLGICHAYIHQTEQAIQALELSLKHNQIVENALPYLSCGLNLGRIHLFQGRLLEAEQVFNTVLKESEHWQLTSHSSMGLIYLHLAIISYYRGQRDAVWLNLQKGLDLSSKAYNENALLGFEFGLELCCRLENWDLMEVIFSQMETVRTHSKHIHFEINIKLYQAWKALKNKDWDQIDSWCKQSIENERNYKEWLIRAEYYLALKDYPQALRFLEPIWDIALKGHYVPMMLETLCLQAIALHKQPELAEAKLKQALDIMGKEKFYFIWHDKQSELLAIIKNSSFDTNEISVLEDIYPDLKSTFLTHREYELLNMMANGLTNPQIAEHMFVSVNTVKTHLKHLFRKIQVDSRTEAVAKAIANQWLQP